MSSIASATAPTTGGRSVLLTGTNFLGASSVLVGSVAASITVLSDMKIVALVPAQSAGSVNVTVTTPSGTSSAVSFTYYTNSAPSGASDSYSPVTGVTTTVAASGVLGNDSDGNSDPLFLSWYSLPSHGVLTVLGDGSFVYKSDASYLGSDSFTYRASDGTAESGTVTVSLTVVSPQQVTGPALSRCQNGRFLAVC